MSSTMSEYEVSEVQVEGFRDAKIRSISGRTFYSACGTSVEDGLFFCTGSFDCAKKAIDALAGQLRSRVN